MEGDNVVKLLYKGVSAERQIALSKAMPDILVPILDIGKIVEKFSYRGTTTLGDTREYIVMPKLNPISDESVVIIEKYRYLLPQILEKIDKLHSLGYIHGDSGINNVLVDNQGNVYLSDLDTMISRNEIKENPALFTKLLENHSYECLGIYNIYTMIGRNKIKENPALSTPILETYSRDVINGFMAYERNILIEYFSTV